MSTAIHVPKYGSRIEHAIVRTLIETLDAAGFVPVAVWDTGGYVYSPHTSEAAKRNANGHAPVAMTTAEVMDAVFAASRATIHFAPFVRLWDWGAYGVRIVGGNEWDCISDWHVSEKRFAVVLDAFLSTLEERPIILAPLSSTSGWNALCQQRSSTRG